MFSLVCLLLAAQPLMGQKNLILKCNPLSLGAGTLNIQTERRISTRLTAQIGVFVGTFAWNSEEPSLGKTRFLWMGFTPEIRFYPAFLEKKPPEGFYISGYLRARYTRTSWNGPVYDRGTDSVVVADNQARIGGFGMGGMVGYQFRIKEKFTLEVFGGPQMMIGRPVFTAECSECDGDERNDFPRKPDFTGLELRAGIALGFDLHPHSKRI